MKEHYENLSLTMKEFPIIFHTNRFQKVGCFFVSHWHENIELLFMTEGTTEIMLNENSIRVSEGEIVVINSSVTHTVQPMSDFLEYECLIVDKSFCEQFGFFVDEKYICSVLKDDRIFELMKNIKYLKQEMPEYCSAEILSDVLKIMSILFREYADDNYYEKNSKNLEMVKKGIKYINKHLKEALTVDEIADYAGYSKYYFCRCFKEITGYTVNSYINQAKIAQTYKILCRGESTVGDVATEYGFNDISYFTKVFKKYTCTLPSKVQKEEK